MEFDYSKREEAKEVVAYITAMSDEPDKKCLVTKSLNGSVWMYFDGVVDHFNSASVTFDPSGKHVKQVFYKGDSVTITF